MIKISDAIFDTVKQTAQETIGAVEDTTKAIELKGEERNIASNEKEDLIDFRTNHDLQLLEPLSGVAN